MNKRRAKFWEPLIWYKTLISWFTCWQREQILWRSLSLPSCHHHTTWHSLRECILSCPAASPPSSSGYQCVSISSEPPSQSACSTPANQSEMSIWLCQPIRDKVADCVNQSEESFTLSTVNLFSRFLQISFLISVCLLGGMSEISSR